MAFTQDNTHGYTNRQLSSLNAELALRLAGIDPDSDEYRQTEAAFSDEVARRLSTLRDEVTAQVVALAPQASIKQHQPNVHSLYVSSDGELFWDEQPDRNTRLHRDDGTLASLYVTGTGAAACNCEACQAGDDPEEWAGSCDGIDDLAETLGEAVDQRPYGFFEDEGPTLPE